MGFLLVSAVLVVTLGRLGDMYGRVRIYNLGFLVFALASVALSLDPFTGAAGAMWLIIGRVVQGVGGAMLFANSTAILTDAFPANAARHGARHQHGGGDRRLVPRARARRPARRVGLARRVLGQRADRHRRDRLVVPVPARARRTRARPRSTCPGNITFGVGLDRAAGRASPTASSPTAATRPAGPTRGWSPASSAASPCWWRSASSRRRSRSRCSTCRCSGSGRSAPATWPACSPRSAAAACSSC